MSATECSATLTRSYETATRAVRVANSVTPDNTASMTTQVEGSTLTTQISRDSAGGLQSTVDDYVVNLGVAEAVLDAVGESAGVGASDRDGTAAEPTADETTKL